MKARSRFDRRVEVMSAGDCVSSTLERDITRFPGMQWLKRMLLEGEGFVTRNYAPGQGRARQDWAE